MAHWDGKKPFKFPSQEILFSAGGKSFCLSMRPSSPHVLCKCALPPRCGTSHLGSVDSVYDLQILISNEACSFSGKNYLLCNKPASPEAFIWDASIPLRSPNPLNSVQYFWLTNGSLEKWACMQDIIQRNVPGVAGQSIHRNICWLGKYFIFFGLILCQTTQTSEGCYFFISWT